MFSKRHPKVGARPGTLEIGESAHPVRIRMMSYRGRKAREVDVDNLESLSEAFDESTVTWIDVQGFGDEPRIREIAELFQLHPLLLEDIVNVPHRPKAESYGDQLLVIVRMVRTNTEHLVEHEQVSLVLGKHYVLTFQEKHGDVLDPVRARIREGVGPIAQHGPDYLAYALIDTIVDAYYPLLEQIGDWLEALEDDAVLRPTPDVLHRLNRLRNRLSNLRRGIWPQRDAVSAMVRGDHAHISEEVRLYLRDTLDHCVQTTEVTEMYREMVTELINTYLSSLANRTNDVMKVLTIVATIFIPLSFIAGVYGMNFDNMPELHVRWAYPLVWLAMAATAMVMLGFFWRKGWLGGKGES
ncbi:MAG: magnesium/cobalt transporter CorA [Planctomycetales bacterium]|nr:magnesium/cobalt transporter CorA [Planctomycetales bacterium]